MEPDHPGARVLGVEALLHYSGPDLSGGTELGHLFEEVVLADKEEGEPGPELVHVHARIHGGLNVGYGVTKGKGELLDRRTPGFPHVIAAYTYGVPGRKALPAVTEEISDEAHGGAGRVDVGAPCYVFLEDIVLDSSAELGKVGALLLGHGDIKR